MPHDYMYYTVYTVYTVVQQYVLVDYYWYCFGLTSDASTAAVGPYVCMATHYYCSPKQKALPPVTINASRRVFLEKVSGI